MQHTRPAAPELPGTLPTPPRQRLQHDLKNGSIISAATVTNITKSGVMDVERLMLTLLPTAAAYARAPISNFPVGAVALGATTGNLYLGANMEFVGQALSFSVHGEQSAINNAWLNGESGVKAVAIDAAPCGYCRQFLYELSNAASDFEILLQERRGAPNHHAYTKQPLAYYLPQAFGPEALGVRAGLMKPQSQGLSIVGPLGTSATTGGVDARASQDQDGTKNDGVRNNGADDGLVAAALEAANASYSPYTNDYSGVAVQRSDGAIYAGRYAGNAAYNPSLSPLQSALAHFNMSVAPGSPYDIVAAVLVESAEPQASQVGATENVLEAVAPDVALQVYCAAQARASSS